MSNQPHCSPGPIPPTLMVSGTLEDIQRHEGTLPELRPTKQSWSVLEPSPVVQPSTSYQDPPIPSRPASSPEHLGRTPLVSSLAVGNSREGTCRSSYVHILLFPYTVRIGKL